MDCWVGKIVAFHGWAKKFWKPYGSGPFTFKGLFNSDKLLATADTLRHRRTRGGTWEVSLVHAVLTSTLMLQKVCEENWLAPTGFMFPIFKPGLCLLVPRPRKPFMTSHSSCDKTNSLLLLFVRFSGFCPARYPSFSLSIYNDFPVLCICQQCCLFPQSHSLSLGCSSLFLSAK